jgi:cobalt-zinc-cadmium efflux system membrane fusion protein
MTGSTASIARRIRGATLAFVAGAAAAALAGCSRRPDAADAQSAASASDTIVTLEQAQRGQVHTERVEPTEFHASVTTTGTVAFDGDRSTQVLAPISGPVARLLVSPGAVVRAGEPLATVASPDFASAVAGYRKADVSWRNADRIAKQDEQLFANDALSRRDLDQAHADLAAAAADREAARLQLRSLGVDPDAIDSLGSGKPAPGAAAAIRAPIAGTVVERLITPGQLLQAGTTPCFTIADLSTVWVLANVFESDVGAVARGETATITTDASPDTLTGRVDYVAALVDPATKATAVRIVVPNRNRVLRRDMLVRVSIRALEPRTGLLVPVAAVLRDDENLPFVWIAAGGTRFARRRIELGQRIGDRYEVRSGLAAGDVVATDGALFLEGATTQ